MDFMKISFYIKILIFVFFITSSLDAQSRRLRSFVSADSRDIFDGISSLSASAPNSEQSSTCFGSESGTDYPGDVFSQEELSLETFFVSLEDLLFDLVRRKSEIEFVTLESNDSDFVIIDENFRTCLEQNREYVSNVLKFIYDYQDQEILDNTSLMAINITDDFTLILTAKINEQTFYIKFPLIFPTNSPNVFSTCVGDFVSIDYLGMMDWNSSCNLNFILSELFSIT